MMKNMIEIKTGIPKPPFLIIAPSGAPDHKHDKASNSLGIFLKPKRSHSVGIPDHDSQFEVF